MLAVDHLIFVIDDFRFVVDHLIFCQYFWKQGNQIIVIDQWSTHICWCCFAVCFRSSHISPILRRRAQQPNNCVPHGICLICVSSSWYLDCNADVRWYLDYNSPDYILSMVPCHAGGAGFNMIATVSDPSLYWYCMPILTATYTRNIEIDQFDCFPAIDIAIDMPMIADYALCWLWASPSV